ncbi:Coronatine-insensitive protein [Asimina triloba]
MASKKSAAASFAGIPDAVLERVFDYIDDSQDRAAVSLVCRRWYAVDALTRRHVSIPFCYSASPALLRNRFPNVESLTMKGKPRAVMYNLLPQDWGGHAGPWVKEISVSFHCLKSIYLRRMNVTDRDLGLLARSRGCLLQSIKLAMCCGFSTDGLLEIAKSCRNLRTLSFEECFIIEKDGNWLHEIAQNSTLLETLSFYLTEMNIINVKDLELIARNCRSLICLKIGDTNIFELKSLFREATTLEEFGGGHFDAQIGEADWCSNMSFPPRLCRFGLSYMDKKEMPMIFPRASIITKLDLRYAFLDTEDHCQLIQRCGNLEVLLARDVIGDCGLEVVAQHCKNLRQLRVERGADEDGLEDEHGVVTHHGLCAVAKGCLELETIVVNVSDITNAALECFGIFSKRLRDFRVILLDRVQRVTELPLDNGVRALLMGCKTLQRFALYLRPGALTDAGLGHIGRYGENIRCMLLGRVGESDVGLLELSKGCPRLKYLELRCVGFSGHALSLAVTQMASLKYMWVQGCNVSKSGSELSAMCLPFWNVEFIPSRRDASDSALPDETSNAQQSAHVIAYHSLAGQRTDYPGYVVPIHPSPFG